MADYIDTKAARRKIADNARKIAALERQLTSANEARRVKLAQEITDLSDENALLEKQIAAQHDAATGTGTSGTNTGGTNYTTTVKDKDTSSNATSGGGDGAASEAAVPGLNWDLVLAVGAGLLVLLAVGFSFVKRRKRAP